ncbi:lipase secretion chaperone [Rhizobacter sp. SG703]|uniref:lipase secretion chaperone n=1 Tax=Rhizobacter sp. SG703 TaxID=2587140 RepID=UPI001445F17E|nr:lipase secretion chaperone [Rhizobacter sp. SG703]NKI94523.1 lipase chaperone LimK [Rhizobacter sp. SG703]
MSDRPASLFVVSVAGLCLLVGIVAWRLAPSATHVARPAEPRFTEWRDNPFAAGVPSDAAAYNEAASHEAEAAAARVARLWVDGSLRGTDLDGDWGTWAGDRLQPGLSLRRRFDYLLTGTGEVEPAELRHWIEQQLTLERGIDAARQVLDIWDRYLSLQQRRFETAWKPDDPASWAGVMAERSKVRRDVLGAPWAQAFYADEERDLAALAARRGAPPTDGAAPPPSLLTPDAVRQTPELQAARTARFGAEGAERLRAEDLAWARWEQQIADARAALQAIAQRPELSAPQREQARLDELARRFSGPELQRAHAILLSVAP